MALPRVTEMAHELVARHLRPGDRAIDATVGNGHDTLFLATCVGATGHVDGFDIQPEAIAATAAKTADLPQVRLHLLGHEEMGRIVAGPINAILFNLGYLPSGDKGLATRPATTLAALDAALGLLSETGLLAVVVYPGHEGGKDEAAAVEKWFQNAQGLRVVRYAPLPGPSGNEPPCLLIAERRARTVDGGHSSAIVQE